MDLVLVIDVGSSFQKLLNCLFVPILSSYPQRSALGTLHERMHKEKFTQHYIYASITDRVMWFYKVHLHTVAARLGSAPFFSRVSTISVCPERLAAYSGLMPSCTVIENICICPPQLSTVHMDVHGPHKQHSLSKA